jgi:hypothetical protein
MKTKLYLTSLFSKDYLNQAIVMIDSFQINHPGSLVHVLALDHESHNCLVAYYGDKISITCLTESVKLYSEFQFWHTSRSKIEAIFTLKVFWLNQLMRILNSGDQILYSDADQFFLREIPELSEESWSLLLSPHYFPPTKETMYNSGHYNAGLLALRVDNEASKVMQWWRERVLEYCGLDKSNGLYADQKYLDEFVKISPHARSFSDRGVNVGMWQIDNSVKFMKKNFNYFINHNYLTSFHFHAFKIYRNYYKYGLIRYGIPFASFYNLRLFYYEYTKKCDKVRMKLSSLGCVEFTSKKNCRNNLIIVLLKPLNLFDIRLRKINI